MKEGNGFVVGNWVSFLRFLKIINFDYVIKKIDLIWYL